jgi:hypothetical protein
MGIVLGCLCHYTQCTDDAIRKGLVSKDKVELLKQIQGLQTQKTDLLTAVMVLLTGSVEMSQISRAKLKQLKISLRTNHTQKTSPCCIIITQL